MGPLRFGLLASSFLCAPAPAQWTWVEETAVEPAVPSTQQRYGAALAVSGDTAVVGAPGDDTLNVDAGAAYVYVNGGSWTEQALLTASDGFIDDGFGAAVAIDGDTLVVGSPRKEPQPFLWDGGAAYVFVRVGSAWSEQARLVSSSPGEYDELGRAVAVSGDTILVGVPLADHLGGGGTTYTDQGAVHVFTRAGTIWTEQAVLTLAQPLQDARFGSAVALDGDTAVIGAPAIGGLAGSAHVFARSGTTWTEETVVPIAGSAPGDALGAAVAVAGARLLVGAPALGNGSAHVLARTGSTWAPEVELQPSTPQASSRFGGAVALVGERALVGAPLEDLGGVVDAGAAYAFRSAGLAWIEESKLVPSALEKLELGSGVAWDGGTAWLGGPARDVGTPLLDVRGLAPEASGSSLLGLDFGTGQLASISESTAAASTLATFPGHQVKSLAHDPSTGTHYGVDVVTDELVALHVPSATLSIIGPVGFDRVQGLAFDPSGGVLYGVDRETSQLLTIDTSTGSGTVVGPVTAISVRGLAFDTTTNRLHAAGGPLGQLVYDIDPATGETTQWGSFPSWPVEGIAYDPVLGGRLFGVIPSADLLMSIRVPGGVPKWIGPVRTAGEDGGVAHVFGRQVGAAIGYCTAGTSSSGCTATLSATGTASATQASGFDLLAAGVEGAKDGLFFFGTSGRQANPWGNGTSLQCVVPPVARGGVMTGVGTAGACDGAFALDLNARWCPTCPRPGQNPGAGATVQAQLWYRDPSGTSNQTTSLSDALELGVGP